MNPIVILIAISLGNVNLFSQSLFSDFTAQQFGDSIIVKWTLKAGNTCFDMNVERSGNENTFQVIYTVPGLCGASEDLKYEFYDTDILDGFYNYRITGSNGFYTSDTVDVNFIVVGQADLVVNPNPTGDIIFIGISPTLSFPFHVELYDLQGRVLYSVVINSRQHNISVESLQAGYYLVSITDDRGHISYKKVLVQ